MSPGQLRERLAFDKRADASTDTEYGATQGDFEEQFRSWARIRPLKGGEQVIASRLAGQQPVIITIRYSDAALDIANDWRARDVRTGTVYAITAPPANMDERRRYLDILATAGAAP